MIPYPSKKFFRQQLIFGLIVWSASYVVSYYNYDVNSVGEADVLTWNYYGSKIPEELVWLLNMFLSAVFVIGVIGMIFFQGWGRILLLVQLVIGCFITPFMGLIVTTGALDMLYIISSVLIGVPFILSFFEPCSSYFQTSSLPRSELLRKNNED